jgi:hypothetical protein
VSLNNRISIRNTYESRNGKVFDFQVVSVPGSTRLDVTKDTINLEAEQSQEDLRNQPVAETEVEERVNSESCDRHIIVLPFYAFLDYRRCVMPIIRTSGDNYGLQIGRHFESTIIDLLINYNICYSKFFGCI